MIDRAWSLIRVASLTVASCTGTIGEGVEAGDTPGMPAGGSGGASSPGRVLPSPDTGLWRLTRTDYSNTVRDLLGDTTRAGAGLVPDLTPAGGIFDNNASGQSIEDRSIVEYERTASNLVETAFRARSAARMKLLGSCDPV